VIIGIGMVGITAKDDSSLANLYMSRDAGKTWKRILSGAWKFDSSVTANLIAASQWNGFTDTLLYTQDQGSSWNKCQFASPGLKNHSILDINTDLAGNSPYLWVTTHWTNYEGNETGYSIFFMDFNFTMRTCNDSDYEYFTPSSNLSNCVLGEEIVVERRKQYSICETDLTEQNLTSITSCNCSRTDYVCSYCFVPDQNTPGNPCILQDYGNCIGLWDPTPPPAVCPVGTNYTGNPAYRKINGTKCINDIAEFMLPRTIPCPPTPPEPYLAPVNNSTEGLEISKAEKTSIIVGVILGMVGLVIIGVIFYFVVTYYVKKNNTFQVMRNTSEYPTEL